jgi:hypothetical protein
MFALTIRNAFVPIPGPIAHSHFRVKADQIIVNEIIFNEIMDNEIIVNV